jgi:hypothetical protein
MTTMNEHQDDPFDSLRRLAGDPQPSPDAEQQALRRLETAIAADTTPTRSRWWTISAAAAAAAAVAVAAAAVLFAGQAPVAATLDQIARAARQATPLEVPAGEFIYQRTESVDLVVRPGVDLGADADTVAYLLPTRRESWRQPETLFLVTMASIGEPVFFDQSTEAAYLAGGGRSLDQVGEIIVERFTDVDDPIADTDWPTTGAELRIAMEHALAQGADTRRLDVELFDLAIDILRSATEPHLRAAVIEVLAGLDLDTIEPQPDGTVTLSIVDHTAPSTRHTATIAGDGTLAAETVILLEDAYGIPANSVITTTIHQTPQIVNQLPPGD